MKIDHTLNDRQNRRFHTLYSNSMVMQIARSGPFSTTEVESILMIYHKFAILNGITARFMTRNQFVSVIICFQQLYDINIVERIVSIICKNSKYVSPIEFVDYINIILMDDLERKIDFVYQVYDETGAGINREMICINVTGFFRSEDEDELQELRTDMVDFILTRFDLDRDGVISFNEYKINVMERPALLEFLGPVFPKPELRQVLAYCVAITSLIPELACLK